MLWFATMLGCTPPGFALMKGRMPTAASLRDPEPCTLRHHAPVGCTPDRCCEAFRVEEVPALCGRALGSELGIVSQHEVIYWPGPRGRLALVLQSWDYGMPLTERTYADGQTITVFDSGFLVQRDARRQVVRVVRTTPERVAEQTSCRPVPKSIHIRIDAPARLPDTTLLEDVAR